MKLRCASKKVHETMILLLKELKPKKIIDLGSGKGGFVKLVHEAGFDIVATDINVSQFKVPQVKIIKSDLDKEVPTLEKFGLVTCSELIEHVENPTNILRMAHKLLNKNGRLILTTPNSENWFSRLFFLFTAKFPMFKGDKSWVFGHKLPMFTWFLEMQMEGLFTIEKMTFNRSVLPLVHIELPIKNLFFGQNIIYILKKAN